MATEFASAATGKTERPDTGFARWIRTGLAAVTVLAISVFAAHPASADSDPVAERFIADLANQTQTILSDKDRARLDRIGDFRTLFVENTDLRRFGRSVLGRRYARVPTAEEFVEYLDALEDYAVEILFAQFSLFSDHELRVTRSDRQSTSSSTYAIVATDVVNPNRKTEAVVRWILRASDAEYKIFDIRVESADGDAFFSLLKTQRDEFTQVLNQNGGSIAGLIAYLREGTKTIREREAAKDASANETADPAGDSVAAAQ